MKDPQLWISSRASGRGKSTLLMLLSKMLRIYRPSRNEWDDEWENGRYDLIIIDEYRGWKSIDWINMFAEGSPMPLKRRGTCDILKTDKTPMIVCSNLTIFEAYAALDHNSIHLIEARFDEVEVGDEVDIRIDFNTVDFNDL